MSESMASTVALVKTAIEKINEHWLNKDYEKMGEYICQEAVIVPPGDVKRISGRDAYVQSYRDYDQMATTHEYLPDEPQIDVVGDVAVAMCPFKVVYELEGNTYHEQGSDLLVFSCASGTWQVAWRTMQTAATAG